MSNHEDDDVLVTAYALDVKGKYVVIGKDRILTHGWDWEFVSKGESFDEKEFVLLDDHTHYDNENNYPGLSVIYGIIGSLKRKGLFENGRRKISFYGSDKAIEVTEADFVAYESILNRDDDEEDDEDDMDDEVLCANCKLKLRESVSDGG